jgi:hypothetical protein
MQYDVFKRTLKEARVPVKTLAAVLGIQPTSITNYKGSRGEVPRHIAVVATLLRELASHGIPVETALEAYLSPQRTLI